MSKPRGVASTHQALEVKKMLDVSPVRTGAEMSWRKKKAQKPAEKRMASDQLGVVNSGKCDRKMWLFFWKNW